MWTSVNDAYPPVGRLVWMNLVNTDHPLGQLQGYWSGRNWRMADHREVRGTVTHWLILEKPMPPRE